MALHIRILAGWLDRRAGSHLYHRELTRQLASRGYRVSLVCFDRGIELADYAEVFQVLRPEYGSKRFFWRVSPLLLYRSCTAQVRKSKIPPADIVIGGEHLLLRPHWRKFRRTPWIYLPHSLVVSQEIQSYELPMALNWTTQHVYNHIQRWALNNADRTLRFTNHACEALSTHYGTSVRPRYTINPMGVEAPAIFVRKPIGDPLKILWVGQLISRKRIDVALNALAQLRGYNWVFDIVGDGPSRDALERQTKALGLRDRVKFYGFQLDPFRWYRAADLFLFPSWLENSPLSMLESMSCGVPCLAMRGDAIHFHNANSEIIEDGRDGFLAESDEHFVVQLERILKEPGILNAVGEAARQTIISRHTWDAHLNRYESLFRELLSETRKYRNRSRAFQRSVRVSKPSTRRVVTSTLTRDGRPVTTRNISFALHHMLASGELGGAGLMALRLAKELNEKNSECHIWVPESGAAEQMARQFGFSCRNWDSSKLLNRSKFHAAWGNSQIAWGLRRYGQGIVHVHSPYLYGASHVGLKLSGLKRVVHVHLEESVDGLRWAFKYPPDLIITCAQYLVDTVRESLPDSAKEQQRLVVVPNAVDTREYFPGDRTFSKERLGLAGEMPLIVVIANLARHKGQETAVRAVAELKKQGIDVMCWLLGKERDRSGTYTHQLESLINHFGIADRVSLIGYRYDTPEILRAADFLLLPSTREGLPLSVLEAQATKVPVLASPIPGNRELVCDGKTGFLIDSEDYAGYSDTLEKLIKNKEMYWRIADEAYREVKREHDWSVYCEHIWELYSDLLDRDDSPKMAACQD